MAEQRVPEIHLGWYSHCKTHDLVRRPGCIAVNARGDAIISDLEGNVLVMVSRHLPAQVKVIAGKWGASWEGGCRRGRWHPCQALVSVGTRSILDRAQEE